jgi:hypothetical protein
VTDETTTPETMTQDETPKCENCAFRAKAEAKPKSFLAWLWRVHTKFCPGWKQYQRWLAEQEAGGSAGSTETS